MCGLIPAGQEPSNALRRHAAELAALAPDVILAHGNAAVGALLQVTRTVPIVFPVSGDPVATGFVDSLARPAGKVTGFSQFEFNLSGKWPELLKQIIPRQSQHSLGRQWNPELHVGRTVFSSRVFSSRTRTAFGRSFGR
jgi:putative ABC transport system substrate-binding protein